MKYLKRKDKKHFEGNGGFNNELIQDTFHNKCKKYIMIIGGYVLIKNNMLKCLKSHFTVNVNVITFEHEKRIKF